MIKPWPHFVIKEAIFLILLLSIVSFTVRAIFIILVVHIVYIFIIAKFIIFAFGLSILVLFFDFCNFDFFCLSLRRIIFGAVKAHFHISFARVESGLFQAGKRAIHRLVQDGFRFWDGLDAANEVLEPCTFGVLLLIGLQLFYVSLVFLIDLVFDHLYRLKLVLILSTKEKLAITFLSWWEQTNCTLAWLLFVTGALIMIEL